MEMKQPSLPNTNTETEGEKKKAGKKKPPTPKELISHYQSQGLNSEEASVKVIEDLQNVLFRVISATNKNKKDKLASETLKKVDVVHNRLAILDMKVDSKPGYVETLALGVASGAAFRGIETVWPHVFGGIAQIWTSATKPPS